MAKEIKTRTVHKNIKSFNKSVKAASHMKNAYVKEKEDKAQERETPERYAEGRISGAAGEAMHQTVKQAGKAGNVIRERKDLRREQAEQAGDTGETVHYQPKEEKYGQQKADKTVKERPDTAQEIENDSSTPMTQKEHAARREAAKKEAGRKAGEKNAERNRTGQENGTGRQTARTSGKGERTTRTVRTSGTMRQSIKENGKGGFGSPRFIKTSDRSPGNPQRREGAASERAYRMAERSAISSRKAAKETEKAAQAGNRAAGATEKLIRSAMRTGRRTARIIAEGARAQTILLAAGGWVTVFILMTVVLFGGLFGTTGGDNSATAASVSGEVDAYEPLIRKYAKQYGIAEYVELIKAVMMQESGGKGNDPMQSSQGPFNKKYPHKANAITDPEYSIECGVQELKSCLEAAKTESPMDMDHIRLALQGYNYGNGYIAWAVENYGGYSLANATEFAEKMAKEKHLKSYGDKQYVPHVLRYYSIGRLPSGKGNGAIVQVALTQEGNRGNTYWSWYGFSKRVSWCACFVSWCADQCGYIESGVIPKFSLCSDGVKQFQQRKQFKDGSYVPAAGDIIFFDWGDNGSIDHVGIVENVKKGNVNTIEGNSSDMVKRHSYPVGDSRIYGYGVPAY